MDTSQLARQVWEFNAWLLAQEGGVAEREWFAGAPHGRALVTRLPGDTSPAASLNRNRISLCGAEPGLTAAGLRELVDGFRARHIPKVFLWLSPGAGIERAREWCVELGGMRIPWTRYPTLLFGGAHAPSGACPFDIRSVGVAAFTAAKESLGDVVFDGYARTLEKPGFHHLVAYDGARPIAAAALVQHGELGYLTYAATVESDRRRGAQSALIAARVALAQSLGCTRIVSQTLTLLEDSLANLRRAGFVEIYEQEVFELDLVRPGA